jgi:hypothetical protein
MLSLIPSLCPAQQSITISGYIKDNKTKESLIYANIFVTNCKSSTQTNQYGFYSVTIPYEDTIGLVVSYVGYLPQAKKLVTKSNLRLDIFLEISSNSLSEVVINADRNDNNVQRAQMGVIDIPMRAIKELPVLAGERDILKTIQLLPGVQQGSEGTTGYFVRGGNLDQNLVILDEATVYNPNHLFGLFSTFNVNAINDVKLVKGGFSAEYGGRLSSILDITMKDGNKEKFQAEGGIGLLSANITLQGPIKKSVSYIISARRSYADLLLKPFTPKSKSGTTYYLYDVNGKINWELGNRDHLFLSVFNGKDKAAYTGANSLNYGINFGNATGTLRWNHLFGSRMFLNSSLIFNDYHLGLNTQQGNYYALLYTAIRDIGGKSDLTYIPNTKHTLKAGLNYTYHTLYPGAVSAKIPKKGNKISVNRDSIPQKYSNELAAYLDDEWKISEAVGLYYGARVPFFFTSNKLYVKIEPRITAKVSLTTKASLKASFTMMNQFLHLVPNSTASLPTDIWITSSKIVKPQNSSQYAIGYFRNLKENNIELSVEAYYKTMQNQVLFKEGTQIVLSTNIDDVLTFGNGTSYGIEFFAKKNFGKLTGWASYTISKTDQTFKEINFGKTFPFTYDRRHNISLAATYVVNKRWTISADFVFYTGSAFTLPNGRIPVGIDGTLYDGVYYDYTTRNNARLRNYHRLDVSASYKKVRKIFKRTYESEWVIGAYNIYSRQNPYFVYLTTDPVTKQPQAKQVSLLPIVPSIGFNFKF